MPAPKRRTGAQARRVGGHDLRLESQGRRDERVGPQRLRALKDENGKLKRLLADSMLDKAALNDLL